MLNCDRELEIGGRRIHFTRPVVSPFDLVVTRKSGVRLRQGDYYAPGEELIVWLEATHGQAQFRANAGAVFTRRLSPRIPIPVEAVDPYPCINMAPIGPKEGDVAKDAPAHSSFPPGTRPKAVLSTTDAKGPLTIYAGHANGFLPTPPYTGAVKVTTKLLLNELTGHPGELSWPGGGFEGDDSGLYEEEVQFEQPAEEEKTSSLEKAQEVAFNNLEKEGWAEAEAWAASRALAFKSASPPEARDEEPVGQVDGRKSSAASAEGQPAPTEVVAAAKAWSKARTAAAAAVLAVGTSAEPGAVEAALSAWGEAEVAAEIAAAANETPPVAIQPPCPECPTKDPPCDDCPFWKPNGVSPGGDAAAALAAEGVRSSQPTGSAEAARSEAVDGVSFGERGDQLSDEANGGTNEAATFLSSMAGGFGACLATYALIAVAVRRRAGASRVAVRAAAVGRGSQREGAPSAAVARGGGEGVAFSK